MRIERWYWLLAFIAVSAVMHVIVSYEGPVLRMKTADPTRVPEIEVELQAAPEPERVTTRPTPPPKPEARPEPKAPRTARNEPKPSRDPRPKSVPNQQAEPNDATKTPKVTAENAPTKPNVNPGGIDPDKLEIPRPIGIPSGRLNAGLPRPQRTSGVLFDGGGGSPSPAPVPGGRGGLAAPEAPPEDIVFNGGGRGGVDLPREVPRLGGGGGRSILGVPSTNPLAEPVPDERPGLGPGRGGGQGVGEGGGVGAGRGGGIGTRPDAGREIASLRAKPGAGFGAGEGDKIGTRAPGGGKGTGAELPGTGGEGTGYGRGKGVGIGEGVGLGSSKGVGGPTGLTRGIPFGDIAGILGGDPNGGGGRGGGPGGPGRGSVFGQKPGGSDRSGAVHIVYLLDSSGSMRNYGKFDKAREALKKALAELQKSDSFNIIHFNARQFAYSDHMLPARRENIADAMAYIDGLQMGDGTNMSAAFQAAFMLENVTHIFLMSDGEPYGGITDFQELRDFVVKGNRQRARIITLALGNGDNFPGVPLMKGIAADNSGAFSYVNLARQP